MPLDNFYTYLHCKPNGEPFYVGKGKKRRSHDFINRNEHHKRIVAKYGVEVFVFPCENESQALDDEIKQIAQLRKEGYELANLTDGGQGTSGLKRSASWCAMISKIHKGKFVSDETRKKMSDGYKKCVNRKTTKGFKASQELRNKLSEAHKGYKITDETKRKMSIVQRERQSSQEYKALMSEKIKSVWDMRKRMKGMV